MRVVRRGGRVPVSSIELRRAEGRTIEVVKEWTKVTSFEDADAILARWRTTAPTRGHGYHKTDFKVTWEDGSAYDGVYDLQQGNHQTLANHIRNHLCLVGGLWKPSHMTIEQEAAFRIRLTNKQIEQAQDMISNLEL